MSQETPQATHDQPDAGEFGDAANDLLRWLRAGGYDAAQTVFICGTAIAAVAQAIDRNVETAELLRDMANVIERGEAVRLVTAP